MKRLFVIFLLLPFGLAAEPWHGNWAAEAEWCQWQDKIGSHNPAPIGISSSEWLGYENSCDITKVTVIAENSWRLDLLCYSEGSEYDDMRVLLMEDSNTLWQWWGGGAPERFFRCKGS